MDDSTERALGTGSCLENSQTLEGVLRVRIPGHPPTMHDYAIQAKRTSSNLVVLWVRSPRRAPKWINNPTAGDGTRLESGRMHSYCILRVRSSFYPPLKEMTTTQDKRKLLGGLSPGTASGRLRRMIMFQLIEETHKNVCFRCQKPMTVDDFSIEHKIPWQSAPDPLSTFFDLKEISFSHLLCNTGAAKRGIKHGTPTRYSRGKCRCDLCVEAKRLQAARFYTKEKRRKKYLAAGN